MLFAMSRWRRCAFVPMLCTIPMCHNQEKQSKAVAVLSGKSGSGQCDKMFESLKPGFDNLPGWVLVAKPTQHAGATHELRTFTVSATASAALSSSDCSILAMKLAFLNRPCSRVGEESLRGAGCRCYHCNRRRRDSSRGLELS